MKRGMKSHTVDTVFVLVLFCVFAAQVLLVLMSGAAAYKDTASAMEERFEERTCVSYIAAKLRHYDGSGLVEISEFDGVNALVLGEEYDGTPYATMIYLHEGQVKELFYEKGLTFYPDDGLSVIPAEALSFRWLEDGMMEISCTGRSGREASLIMAIRSDGEVL